MVLATLLALIIGGFLGSRDPLRNPLPLAVWTVWWVGIVSLHGIMGNLWRALNPWSGAMHLMRRGSHATEDHRIRLPDWTGRWFGCLSLLGFASFVLADPAPDDPQRLAVVLLLALFVGFVGARLFGEAAWFTRVDGLSILMNLFASLSPLTPRSKGGIRLGLPGRSLVAPLSHARSSAVFCILLLGIGSYDGLNETFWWLSHLGINPLEFPGRSALMGTTVIGLLAANAVLLIVFTGVAAIGVYLSRRSADVLEHQRQPRLGTVFNRMAPTLVPIAFGYHIAHYLTSFLVNGQYAIEALSDPTGHGHNLLGLSPHFVSTGFFNTTATVKAIWLAQASAVTIGHILSLLLAHRVAEELYRGRRSIVLSQLPMVIFMCLYTGFGLWLLAAPKGA